MDTSDRFCGALGLVLVVALVVNLGIGFGLGVDRSMASDSLYFRGLARSLAAGDGYVFKSGFWPDAPSMSRFPGWPLVVAAGLRMMPRASEDVVMRLLALFVNAAAAGAVCALTYLVFRRRWIAAVSGLVYALHPTALYVSYLGLSEPLFVLLAVLGICLLLTGKGISRCCGALLLGYACLIRGNFILWPLSLGILGAIAVVRRGKSRQPVGWSFTVGSLCVVLFLLLPVLWAVRNHRICGRFPVLSTLRGQTLYGGNNRVVADQLIYWGYWVFPNEIPGETPMVELARTMSEIEVDEYYYNKGKRYVWKHRLSMPRLLLGKLVRAYVPVPWRPGIGGYAVSAYRWLLYATVAVGLAAGWRRASWEYRLFLSAMLLTSLATTLVFWGNARFTFTLEPFLLPFFPLGVARVVQRYGCCYNS